MERLVPRGPRLHAPVVETVRDPQFLAAVRGATEGKQIVSARAVSIAPGRTFDVTAAPLPGGGAVAVLRDLTETERVEKTRRDFIANARTSYEFRLLRSRATPKPCSIAPSTTATNASSWKLFARMPPVCRASPKIC